MARKLTTAGFETEDIKIMESIIDAHNKDRGKDKMTLKTYLRHAVLEYTSSVLKTVEASIKAKADEKRQSN